MSYSLLLLVGAKHSGKTTVGGRLAARLGVRFYDLDDELVAESDGFPDARSVYRALGRDGFRDLETRAALSVAARTRGSGAVVACGGGTVENEPAFEALAHDGLVVFLDVPVETLARRVFSRGIPAFVDPGRPREHFREICEHRRTLFLTHCDLRIEPGNAEPDQVAGMVENLIQEKKIGRQ